MIPLRHATQKKTNTKKCEQQKKHKKCTKCKKQYLTPSICYGIRFKEEAKLQIHTTNENIKQGQTKVIKISSHKKTKRKTNLHNVNKLIKPRINLAI